MRALTPHPLPGSFLRSQGSAEPDFCLLSPSRGFKHGQEQGCHLWGPQTPQPSPSEDWGPRGEEWGGCSGHPLSSFPGFPKPGCLGRLGLGGWPSTNCASLCKQAAIKQAAGLVTPALLQGCSRSRNRAPTPAGPPLPTLPVRKAVSTRI